MIETVYYQNDTIIRLVGLKDEDGNFLNASTVTGQIKDSAGANVGSSIACSYQAGTNGEYRGLIVDTESLTENQRYDLEVTADDGPDRKGFWKIPFVVRKRTGNE